MNMNNVGNANCNNMTFNFNFNFNFPTTSSQVGDNNQSQNLNSNPDLSGGQLNHDEIISIAKKLNKIHLESKASPCSLGGVQKPQKLKIQKHARPRPIITATTTYATANPPGAPRKARREMPPVVQIPNQNPMLIVAPLNFNMNIDIFNDNAS